MSDRRMKTPAVAIHVCPVAEKLQKYTERFDPAARDAISLAEDLDDALCGLAADLTPADLKAADQEPLEVARDNLQDLFDQVQEALLTVQRILELRAAPDPLQGYSREELEMEIAPMLLAKFRQLASWYLLRVPALIEQIDQCEATLHPDDVAGLIKREAAREFPCGRG